MKKVTSELDERGSRLQSFDEATRRQELRQMTRKKSLGEEDRGWTRDELYESPSDRLADAGEVEG